MAITNFPDLQVSVDAYATIGHIEALNPTRTFNTTLSPTRFAVASFLNNAFNALNAELSILGYDTPIPSTNSTALSVVRHLNALNAAHMTEMARFSAGNSERSDHAPNMKERYLDKIQMLKDGKMAIPNATRSNKIHRIDEKEPESAFDVDSSDNDRDPVFKKGMQF